MADQTQGSGSTEKFQASAKQAEEAEAKKKQAYEKFVAKSKETGESLKKTRETLKKSKKAMEEANAEEVAAQEDGPISITEALKLIDQEAETKKQHRQNERQVLKESAGYLKDTVIQGFGLVGESLKAGAAGVADSYMRGSSMIPLLAGGAAGLVFGDNILSQTVSSGVQAWNTLRNGAALGEGVEEKFVPGLSSEEEMEGYLTKNGNGEPNEHTTPGEGVEPAEEKNFETTPGASVPASEDALQTSDQEMQNLSELGKAFDDALKIFEKSDNTLVSSVATFVEAQGGAKVIAPAMAALNEMLAQKDKEDEGKENEGDEPGYPGA